MYEADIFTENSFVTGFLVAWGSMFVIWCFLNFWNRRPVERLMSRRSRQKKSRSKRLKVIDRVVGALEKAFWENEISWAEKTRVYKLMAKHVFKVDAKELLPKYSRRHPNKNKLKNKIHLRLYQLLGAKYAPRLAAIREKREATKPKTKMELLTERIHRVS